MSGFGVTYTRGLMVVVRMPWLILMLYCCSSSAVAYIPKSFTELPLIARFMGLIWGPFGADRTQVGPMLAPWTLLSGVPCAHSGLERHIYLSLKWSLSYLCILASKHVKYSLTYCLLCGFTSLSRRWSVNMIDRSMHTIQSDFQLLYRHFF